MKTTNAPPELKADGLAISPDACLNEPGFGYENRVSERCRQGTFNAGYNREPCQDCPAGMTTSGLGATSTAACIASAGFEVVDGVAKECSKGFFNDGDSGACQPCDAGFTTETAGATSIDDCSLCLAGHGGPTCAECESGSFAPANNAVEPCTPCPAATDFIFQYPGISDEDFVYTSPTTSIAAAPSRQFCVAAFMQMSNQAPLTTTAAGGGMVLQSGITGLQGCADECSRQACQFLTFSYEDRSCRLRLGIPGRLPDNTFCVLAYKQLTAGNIGIMSPPGGGSNPITAKSVGSGSFSFYNDSACEEVDGYVSAAATQLLGQCMQACTADATCAAVRLSLDATTGDVISCGYIRPAADGGGVRSLIRADVARTSLQSLLQAPTAP